MKPITYQCSLPEEKMEMNALLIENLTEGVLVTDAAQRIIQVNRAFLKLTGYSATEVIGRKPKILRSGKHKPDFYREMWKSIHQTGRWEGEIWNRKKNGEIFVQEMTINKVEIKEKIYYVGLYRDITARKEMENQLKNSNALMSILIENLQSGVILTDTDEEIKYINTDFCRLLQLDHDPEWYIGKDIRKYIIEELPLKNGGCFEEIHSLIEAEQPIQNQEIFFKDGSVFSCTFVPIFIAENHRLNFWKIKDITSQKRIESTLVAAKENTEQANRSKSEFLSMMSHELRTPLNAILGFAQLLESDIDIPLSAKQRESVAEILGAGRHLLKLIDEILDLAKIDTQKFRLEMEWVNVHHVIQECIHFVKKMALEKQIKIVDLTNNVENSWLQADPIRLNQILLNLLTNAIKYNHKDGAVIISALPTTHDITIEVRDTGIGIPREEIENIFEPFYRLDPANLSIEGTGIGLALVQQMVQLIGGKLGVDSEAGRGSCFWVRLPIIHNEEDFSAQD